MSVEPPLEALLLPQTLVTQYWVHHFMFALSISSKWQLWWILYFYFYFYSLKSRANQSKPQLPRSHYSEQLFVLNQTSTNSKWNELANWAYLTLHIYHNHASREPFGRLLGRLYHLSFTNDKAGEKLLFSGGFWLALLELIGLVEVGIYRESALWSPNGWLKKAKTETKDEWRSFQHAPPG